MSACDQTDPDQGDLSQFGVFIDTQGSNPADTSSSNQGESPQYYSRENVGPLDEALGDVEEEPDDDTTTQKCDSSMSSSAAKSNAAGEPRSTPGPRNPPRMRSGTFSNVATFTGRYYDNTTSSEGSTNRRKARRTTSELMHESATLSKNLFPSASSSDEQVSHQYIEPPVSKELQEALQMGSQYQEPPFLAAMRRYGYPPGYIVVPTQTGDNGNEPPNDTSIGYSYDAVARSAIRQRKRDFMSMWSNLLEDLNYQIGAMSNGWMYGCLVDADDSRNNKSATDSLIREIEVLRHNEADREAKIMSSNAHDKVYSLTKEVDKEPMEDQYSDWVWAEGNYGETNSSSVAASHALATSDGDRNQVNEQETEVREEGELSMSSEDSQRMGEEHTAENTLEFFDEESEDGLQTDESMSLGSSSENDENNQGHKYQFSRTTMPWYLVRRPRVCSREFDIGTEVTRGYPSVFLQPILPICTCILPSKRSYLGKRDEDHTVMGMMKQIPGLTQDPPTFRLWNMLPQQGPEPAAPGTENPDEEQLRELTQRIIIQQIIRAPGPAYRSGERLATSQCVPLRSTPACFPWPVAVDFSAVCLVHGTRNENYAISPPTASVVDVNTHGNHRGHE